MRAGSLDRTICILRDTGATPDGMGNRVSDWKPVATVRAAVVQARRDDLADYGGRVPDETVTLRLRWIDGLSTADRIGLGSDILGVVSITEIGRRRGLDVVARRLAP